MTEPTRCEALVRGQGSQEFASRREIGEAGAGGGGGGQPIGEQHQASSWHPNRARKRILHPRGPRPLFRHRSSYDPNKVAAVVEDG